MIWIDHSRDFPKGSHALFSPSQPTWVQDKEEDDVFRRYRGSVASKIGTEVHEEAYECIKTKINFTKNQAVKVLTKRLVLAGISRTAFDPDFLAGNFVNYVSDSIGYNMEPERALYYSKWCAGTADSISFDESRKLLRIHDLKTGILPAKFLQLECYAALFFLEYGQLLNIRPEDTRIELRIYQCGEVSEEYPTAEDILPLMESAIWHTEVAKNFEEG